jgi:hypothetical protein
VIDGVMFNKDVTHSKMRRRIEKPRILLLDCPLEYKKGESQTNVEVKEEEVRRRGLRCTKAMRRVTKANGIVMSIHWARIGTRFCAWRRSTLRRCVQRYVER